MSPRFIGRKTLFSPDRPDDPYLTRWTVISCRWFQVLVHRFHRSDSAAVHDHPWSFLSVVLWRGYGEYLAQGTGALRLVKRRPFSIAFRRAEDRHSVRLFYRVPGADLTAWTLVVTGPRRREWFFYPRGVRVPWRVLVAWGEETVDRFLDGGADEAFFEGQDRYIRQHGELP